MYEEVIKMKKIIIITDNTCDLNQDIIEKEQIVVLQIKAYVGEKNVSDLSNHFTLLRIA